MNSKNKKLKILSALLALSLSGGMMLSSASAADRWNGLYNSYGKDLTEPAKEINRILDSHAHYPNVSDDDILNNLNADEATELMKQISNLYVISMKEEKKTQTDILDIISDKMVPTGDAEEAKHELQHLSKHFDLQKLPDVLATKLGISKKVQESWDKNFAKEFSYENIKTQPASKLQELCEKMGAKSRYMSELNKLKDLIGISEKISAGAPLSGEEQHRLQEYRKERASADLLNKLYSGASKALPWVGGIFCLKYGGDIVNFAKNTTLTVANSLKSKIYKLTHKGINVNEYETVLQRIETRMRKQLIGQDEAIDQIIQLLKGHFESVKQAKVLNKKFEGGLVLYLTGSPATGKSTTMKIISEEMKLGSYTCKMSDAGEDKGNGANTVATRLTKPIPYDNGQVKMLKDTEFAKQVKSGIPTLYCFDEIEKMRSLDCTLQKKNLKNADGKIDGGSVDEMIRNFGDTGQINGVDVSGSIVIATSNETQDDLKNLENSLYNRYKGCNVQFKDFDEQDYRKMIAFYTKDVQDGQKKARNIDVVWSEEAINHYCTEFTSTKVGGRGVRRLLEQVLAKIADAKPNKNQVVYIKYSDEKGLFVQAENPTK